MKLADGSLQIVFIEHFRFADHVLIPSSTDRGLSNLIYKSAYQVCRFESEWNISSLNISK